MLSSEVEVEARISYLLRKRETYQYRDSLPCILYRLPLKGSKPLHLTSCGLRGAVLKYLRTESAHVYAAQVKGEVEAGISYLLRKRETDQYRHFLPRILYETASGGRQAPTFDLP